MKLFKPLLTPEEFMSLSLADQAIELERMKRRLFIAKVIHVIAICSTAALIGFIMVHAFPTVAG